MRRWLSGLVVSVLVASLIGASPSWATHPAETVGVTLGNAVGWESDPTRPAVLVRVPVSVERPLDRDLSVHWTVTAATAQEGVDFELTAPNPLVIRAGRTRGWITARILGDRELDSPLEDVNLGITSLELDGPSAYTVAIHPPRFSGGESFSGFGILDDDRSTGARLAVGDVVTTEGDLGSGKVLVPVTIFEPVPFPVRVDWSAGGLGSGSVVLRAGRTSVDITLFVTPNTTGSNELTRHVIAISTNTPGVSFGDQFGDLLILGDD